MTSVLLLWVRILELILIAHLLYAKHISCASSHLPFSITLWLDTVILTWQMRSLRLGDQGDAFRKGKLEQVWHCALNCPIFPCPRPQSQWQFPQRIQPSSEASAWVFSRGVFECFSQQALLWGHFKGIVPFHILFTSHCLLGCKMLLPPAATPDQIWTHEEESYLSFVHLCIFHGLILCLGTT